MMTTNELIDHMKSKGITFNISSESEAHEMLTKINYYFKLTSYRSSFAKDENGKYQNLDFAYLTDLASIDMQLRDYLFDLSLDIEHGIKVILNNLISNTPEEDGYQIVQDFENFTQINIIKLYNIFKKIDICRTCIKNIMIMSRSGFSLK